MIEDVERRDRRLVIFEHDHFESVRQGFSLDRIGHPGARGAGAQQYRGEYERDGSGKTVVTQEDNFHDG